eukprot:3990125-Lingulodinium_polyedra.AAC.1
MAAPMPKDAPSPPRQVARPLQRQWQSVLERMVELRQPFPTHFNAAAASLSRLDRAYIATPPWAALKYKFCATLAGDPMALH